MKKLKAVVIGLGRMGRRHVEACIKSNEIKLACVVDKNQSLEKEVSKKTDSLKSKELNGILDEIDMAIIATPNKYHISTASPFIKKGIPCLIEKPITENEKEAEELIALSESYNTVLRIGHIERCNPVTETLIDEIKKERKIKKIIARRHNTPSAYNYECDVIMDLMIHDIDLLNFSKILNIKVLNNIMNETKKNIDNSAVIEFTQDNNLFVRLEASRISDNKIRDIYIETNTAELYADLLSYTVEKKEGNKKTNLPVKKIDPIQYQLTQFIAAVKGKKDFLASAKDGYLALRLANNMKHLSGMS